MRPAYLIALILGVSLLVAAPAQAAPYLSKRQARSEATKALQQKAWGSEDATDYWVDGCTRRSRSVVLCEGWINHESASPYYGRVYGSQCHERIRVKKLRGGMPWASVRTESCV